jgi:hypothetical protein
MTDFNPIWTLTLECDRRTPGDTTMTGASPDLMHHNLCYGCGAANSSGLQIKSCWDEAGSTERVPTEWFASE